MTQEELRASLKKDLLNAIEESKKALAREDWKDYADWQHDIGLHYGMLAVLENIPALARHA